MPFPELRTNMTRIPSNTRWVRFFATLSALALLTTGLSAQDKHDWSARLAGNKARIQQRLTDQEIRDLASRPFPMKPIGVFHSPLTPATGAPRQGRLAPSIKAVIEILPQYEDCLEGIEQMSHLYVLFAFDRSRDWHAKVKPPKARKALGLFSTRSPNRPNPIGLTVVRLERVEGRILHVSGVDAFDQTPVLDIKPYIASIDSIPDAGMQVESALGLDPSSSPDKK